ncbi:MAG TPA: hypothetical protein VI916_07880 [Acidimicrobiia bacterium]|nr:hypothetical protein [Acidimicrobiia bacterium]
MTFGLDTLRHVVGVVSHVPNATAEIATEEGQVFRVGATSAPGGPSLPVLRGIFAGAGTPGDRPVVPGGELEQILLSPPVLAVVRDDPPATRELGASHWRVTTTGRTLDVFLWDGGKDEAIETVVSELSEVVRLPLRHVWSRVDVPLGYTVVGFEWPRDDVPAGLTDVLARIGRACERGTAAHR